MTNSQRHLSGFSLLEMMIAMALMAIVVSQVFLAFTTQRKSYEQQERVTEAQTDMRLVTDTILSDLRMAGFMVDKNVAIGSNDGGTANSDILCMSNPEIISDSAFANATSRLDGSSIQTVLTGGDDEVTVSTGDLDIDDNGTNDYGVGAGILISDGTRVHCGVITEIDDHDITFVPSTPSGTAFAPSTVAVAPALVYVQNGTTLVRNGIALSDQIEDLQVEFGVDDDSSGVLEADEFPLDSVNGLNVSRTRVARVHVTSRSPLPDEGFAGQRSAAANRTAGANDNFRRRRATADTLLRNLR